jgi:hypothetical protein
MDEEGTMPTPQENESLKLREELMRLSDTDALLEHMLENDCS